MDRRTKARLHVQLTCSINAGRVVAKPIKAFTENVSRTGILMRWTNGTPLPDVDASLTVDIQLPENSEFGPRMMRCRTNVIRVSQRQDASHEVALHISSMRFVKGKSFLPVKDLATMPLATDRVN